MLGRSTDQDWEWYGRTDPYFGVFVDPKFRRADLTEDAREEFFASGVAHVSRVFQVIRDSFDAGFAPRAALDFGCGVGRVILPLAKRCERVVAVDVSEAMLDEARRNCGHAGVENVSFVRCDDTLAAVSGPFDLLHSYVVFQHVPPPRGERLIARLLALLGEGGIGVVHVLVASPIGRRRRLRRWAERWIPFARSIANLRRGKPVREPLMQMNPYSLNRVFQTLFEAGCHDVHVLRTSHFGHLGVVLFFRKRELPSF